MSIRPAIGTTPPLPMYKTPSSLAEEKVRGLTIHGLVHSNWRKNKATILVLNRLGRRLATFKSTKELLCVFADAAGAHQQALDKADILHWDVSVGSILITHEGRGVLVDWDVHKRVDDSVSQPERIGTFRFLSARYVDSVVREFGPHSRIDDVESFFHVLQWIVLRFVHHGMSRLTLGSTLDDFDTAFLGAWGGLICPRRLECLEQFIWATYKNFNGVLPDLLENLRETIYSRYTSTEDMQEAQAAYQDYQDERKLGPASKYTTMEAKHTILLKQLEDTDWFRNRLRQAAEDPRCPTNDTGTPQAWVSPSQCVIC